LALERGEIDGETFALAAYLAFRIRTRGEVTVTLQQLADAVGWSKHARSLSRALHDLRDRGWIDFAPPKGGRASKYVITLAGLAPLRELDSRPETRQELVIRNSTRVEFSSDTVEIPEAATPLHKTVSETPNLDSVEFRPSLEQSREEKAEQQ